MHAKRLERTITCPDTGKIYPIPAGAAVDDPPADPKDPPADPPADPKPNDPPADPPKDPTPLEQQAIDAIDQLKAAGTEIPEALQAAVNEFRTARSEAAGHRTTVRDLEAKQQRHDEVLQGIAQALGLGGNDDPPDPEALQSQLQQRDLDLKTKTIELAVHRMAFQAEANPDALLDSRSFIDKAAQLDPSADDFDQQLEAAIETAVENNPNLKARQAQASAPSDARSKPPADTPRPQGLRGALTAHIGEQ